MLGGGMSHEDLLLRRNYPEIVWGRKDDGTPKVLTAQFKADVLVTGDTIYINEERWAYDVADVKERVEALQEAVRWIEGDLTLAVEKFYAQEIAEGREGPVETVASPPSEPRWGIVVSNGHQVWWDPERTQHHLSRNWRSSFGGKSYFNDSGVIELTGCPRMGMSKDGVAKVVDFLAADHDEVLLQGAESEPVVKIRLKEGLFVEFGAGAVIFRLDKANDNGLYQYREYFAMTGPGRFVARWRAGKDVARWGGSALQVWQS